MQKIFYLPELVFRVITVCAGITKIAGKKIGIALKKFTYEFVSIKKNKNMKIEKGCVYYSETSFIGIDEIIKIIHEQNFSGTLKVSTNNGTPYSKFSIIDGNLNIRGSKRYDFESLVARSLAIGKPDREIFHLYVYLEQISIEEKINKNLVLLGKRDLINPINLMSFIANLEENLSHKSSL